MAVTIDVLISLNQQVFCFCCSNRHCWKSLLQPVRVRVTPLEENRRFDKVTFTFSGEYEPGQRNWPGSGDETWM
jgi:hypothetical protein